MRACWPLCGLDCRCCRATLANTPSQHHHPPCLSLFLTHTHTHPTTSHHAAPRSYIPDFKLAFEHFCIHTGGRGVIDAIEKQLELLPDNVAPSRETLYRYGNVSSSSIW